MAFCRSFILVYFNTGIEPTLVVLERTQSIFIIDVPEALVLFVCDLSSNFRRACC